MGNLVSRRGGYDDVAYVPEESPFVALDLEEMVNSDGRHVLGQRVGWQSGAPEDVFVHMFSFLATRDLASVAQVSRSWCQNVYASSALWRKLDLSRSYARTDDFQVMRVLTARRFRDLHSLSLEGCLAITRQSIHTITKHCLSLRKLLLTDCKGLKDAAWNIEELVRAVPLARLELWGCGLELDLAADIKTIRPSTNLGFFWMDYCAENGLPVSSRAIASQQAALSAPPPCRHADQVRDRGCWGPVRGRLVYSNTFYHRAGNYPIELLYSCHNHMQSDFTDPDLHVCELCDKMFRAGSIVNDLVCKHCFDLTQLQDKVSKKHRVRQHILSSPYYFQKLVFVPYEPSPFFHSTCRRTGSS